MRRKVIYRNIPCWWNPVNDELTARKRFLDPFVGLLVRIDLFLFGEIEIWREVDEIERMR